MRTSDAELLFVPGRGGSGPDHWQSRWQAKLSTARRVEQRDWNAPRLEDWADALADAVARAEKPVVIVAHGLGVVAARFAAGRFAGRVAGAMLAAPPSAAALADESGLDPAFADIPLAPLPFPSLLFASRNDAHCPFDEAGRMALAWGSALADAGDAGHIDTASGHGPWPEGLLRFASFLKSL
jgi:uncharacterized protein